MFCLEYYFEKVQSIEGGRRLLRIVGDREESPWLRCAIVRLLSAGSDTRLSAGLSKYGESHQGEILATLSAVVAERENNYLLRTGAMSTIGQTLRMNVSKITRADPNVHAVWERTHTVVPVGEMVRAGELKLNEDTWKALKPSEARILANAKLLEAILDDEENEPETVRARAKSMLKAYQRLPLTEKVQTVIDKALQQASD